MDREPLKKPFAFSVALRNVNLGVTGRQNDNNNNNVVNKKNIKSGIILPRAVGDNNHNNNNVIPMKQSNLRIPSKPTISSQRNKSNVKHSHRMSNFYKARGYNVLLRTNDNNSSNNEKYQQPVRPSDSSNNSSTGRRKKRQNSLYKTRRHFDVNPVKYSIGHSQEEHAKRNINRKRPHTMMQQTRNYRGPYLNDDNYGETPEVTIAKNNAIANANIDVIEARLNRASIYVGWGTSSVLMQKVVSRPSTALQAPTSPITVKKEDVFNNNKNNYNNNNNNNNINNVNKYDQKQAVDDQQRQRQEKNYANQYNRHSYYHEEEEGKIIIPSRVNTFGNESQEATDGSSLDNNNDDDDDDSKARIIVRVKPEVPLDDKEDNAINTNNLNISKNLKMSGKIDKEKIEKEHEKQQPVKEEDNSVVDDKENENVIEDIEKIVDMDNNNTTPIKTGKQDNDDDEVETKIEQEKEEERLSQTESDEDILSETTISKTKSKIELTVSMPIQVNDEKNIEEDKEFKEMNAWSEKEDIVALDIMKKKKDESKSKIIAKPNQKMSDVFEDLHRQDDSEKNEEEVAANVKIVEEQVEEEEEKEKEEDVAEVENTIDSKDVNDVDEAEIQRVIAESENRVQIKTEEEEMENDLELFIVGKSTDENESGGEGKEEEQPENVLVMDESPTASTENLNIVEEHEETIKEPKQFPTPDIGISEMFTYRQGADVLGFSSAIFDEIEEIFSGRVAQEDLKNDPPSSKICFENGLRAEEETKIDEAIVWYSLSYGLEIDVLGDLEGPYKSVGDNKNDEAHHGIRLQATYALRSLLRRGELYQSMGCLDQALWDFTRASLLSPKMLVCDYHLAYVEMESHSLKKALETIDHCLTVKVLPKHDPKFISTLWTCKAEIFHQRSEHRLSFKAIDEALKLDPNNWKAYKMRGLWSSSVETVSLPDKNDSVRVYEAFEDYHQALFLYPHDAESVEHLVDIAIHGNNRDILLKCLLKIDIVVRHLKESVSNARGSGDAIKGNAWINGSGWTIGSIEKVPMEEDIAHTYCQRARLYAFLGHIEEAKEDLDTAAMLDSEHPQVFLYRGALSHPEKLVAMAERYGHGIQITSEIVAKNEGDGSEANNTSAKNVSKMSAKSQQKHHHKKKNDNDKDMHTLRQLNAEEQHAIHDLSKCLDLYPESFDALILRASIYLREDMHSAALHDLKEAASIEVEGTDVLLEIARINLQHFHDFDAAIDATTLVIEREPRKIEPYFLRAEAFMRNGHSEESLKDYARLIQLDTSNPWPYLYRGKILANLNRGRLAIYDYISFCKLSPQTPETQSRLGQGYLLLKDFEDAINSLRKAVENQDSVQNLCILGDALMEAGDMSGALQVLNQAIARDPNNVMGHTTLGHCHMRMGRYQSAIVCYDHAVNLDSRNPMTYNNRGVCKTLLKHDQIKQELAEKKKRLRRLSMTGGANLWDDDDDDDEDDGRKGKRKKKRKGKKKRGKSKGKKKKKGKKGRRGRRGKRKPIWKDVDDVTLAQQYDTLVGLEDFNKSLSMNKKYIDARLNRAEMYLLAHRNQKALQDLNVVIEQDPKCNSAYINRGVLHCAGGRYAAAIRDFDFALTIDDENALTYFNRGVAYSYIGDYNQAIDDYTTSLKLAPASIAALRNRGLLHLRDGNYNFALKDLEDVLDAVHDTPQEHQHSDLTSAIAHCELHSNRLIPDAIHAFNKSIEEHPDAIEAHIGRGNVYLKLALRDEPIPKYLDDNNNNHNSDVDMNSSMSMSMRKTSKLMSQHEKDITELNLQLEGIQARSKGFMYWLNLAQKDFAKALKLDPYQVEARANTGFLLYVQGKFKQSLKAYNGALKMFPNHRKTLEGRALVYMALKQYKKAYDDISAAMEDEDSNAVITNILEMIRVRKAMGGTMDDWEPEDAVKQEQEERRARTLKNMKRECDCLVTRSMIRLKMDRAYMNSSSDASPSLESCNDLLHAIEKGEKYKVPCYTAYYDYGTILLRSNKIEKAIEMFDKCIGCSPDPYYLAYVNRGIAYGILSESDKAMNDFNYVLKHQPSNIHLLYNRAVLHKLNHNFQDALSDLNRAIMYSPDDAQLYSERGRIYSAQNKMKMAMVDFSIALQLDETSF